MRIHILGHTGKVNEDAYDLQNKNSLDNNVNYGRLVKEKDIYFLEVLITVQIEEKEVIRILVINDKVKGDGLLFENILHVEIS